MEPQEICLYIILQNTVITSIFYVYIFYFYIDFYDTTIIP